jgi:hypothetical protein
VLLVIPGTAILRVFALTGMDTVIPNFTSLARALAQTAATANGHGRQRNEGDAAPQASRRDLAPAGELPGTLKRSSKEAQQTFTRALARAVQAYGEGNQANRAAYAEFARSRAIADLRSERGRPLSASANHAGRYAHHDVLTRASRRIMLQACARRFPWTTMSPLLCGGSARRGTSG